MHEVTQYEVARVELDAVVATVTAAVRRIELSLSLGDERIERIRQQGLFVGVVLVERTSIHAGYVNDARDGERGEVFGSTQLEQRVLQALLRSKDSGVHVRLFCE